MRLPYFHPQEQRSITYIVLLSTKADLCSSRYFKRDNRLVSWRASSGSGQPQGLVPGLLISLSIAMDALAARFAPMNISDNSQQLCDRLCCSPMIHYQELPSSKVPDLDVPVLPIFRPENFSSAMQYSMMLPVLRLATHFLLSNSAVVYINTIVDGVIRDPSGAACSVPTSEEMQTRRGFWSIWPRTGMDDLTHETRQRAMQILVQMADMITFREKDLADTRKAQCTAPSPVDQRAHPVFPGEKSLIELSKKDCTELARLTWQEVTKQAQQSKPAPRSLELVEMWFTLAHNIVHEFSRALSFAAHGTLPRELCYKDSVMSEAGFELEAQIFGCLINSYIGCGLPIDAPHRRPSMLPPMLIATDWPSPQRAITYRDVAALNIYTGGPIQRYELARRVPWSWLIDLMTNEFWYAQHNRQDTLPISVPTVGCCIWWAPRPQTSLRDFENRLRRFGKRPFGAVQSSLQPR